MTDIFSTPAYRKAFLSYVRRGTPLQIALKAVADMGTDTEEEAPGLETHYIWHTAGDDKVRPSHAANEGQIFAWDSPPPTGHPGAEINCRCSAESYVGEVDSLTLKESTLQRLIYAADDAPIKPAPDRLPTRWTSADMYLAYQRGKITSITLQELGHLSEMINFVENHPLEEDWRNQTISRRFINQIAEKIRLQEPGPFQETFSGNYNFGDIEWAHGEGTLSGRAQGYFSRQGPFLIFSANINYEFSDEFRDPYSTDQNLGIVFETGTPYKITGSWKVNITGIAYADRERSLYAMDKKPSLLQGPGPPDASPAK